MCVASLPAAAAPPPLQGQSVAGVPFSHEQQYPQQPGGPLGNAFADIAGGQEPGGLDDNLLSDDGEDDEDDEDDDDDAGDIDDEFRRVAAWRGAQWRAEAAGPIPSPCVCRFIRKTLQKSAFSHEEQRAEFRCLDYSPLVNVRPVDLTEQVRRGTGGRRQVQPLLRTVTRFAHCSCARPRRGARSACLSAVRSCGVMGLINSREPPCRPPPPLPLLHVQ